MDASIFAAPFFVYCVVDNFSHYACQLTVIKTLWKISTVFVILS